MRTALTLAALVVISCACTAFGGNTAQHSPKPTLAIASPTVTATWASFTTGAYQHHTTLADGLEITDVETGTGPVARAHDLLTVQYILWLTDGRQINSSDDNGQPFKFTLGAKQVISGWEEGVPGMAVGGTRRLVIPPSLAYGAKGAANSSGVYVIPPNATLVCIVKLVGLAPAAS